MLIVYDCCWCFFCAVVVVVCCGCCLLFFLYNPCVTGGVVVDWNSCSSLLLCSVVCGVLLFVGACCSCSLRGGRGCRGNVGVCWLLIVVCCWGVVVALFLVSLCVVVGRMLLCVCGYSCSCILLLHVVDCCCLWMCGFVCCVSFGVVGCCLLMSLFVLCVVVSC